MPMHTSKDPGIAIALQMSDVADGILGALSIEGGDLVIDEDGGAWSDDIEKLSEELMRLQAKLASLEHARSIERTATRWAVVVEYDDGTVGTNGPYDSGAEAIDAARQLGDLLLEREIGNLQVEEDGWTKTIVEEGVHYEDAGGSTLDVYASEMGLALDIPNGGREE